MSTMASVGLAKEMACKSEYSKAASDGSDRAPFSSHALPSARPGSREAGVLHECLQAGANPRMGQNCRDGGG